jgi:metal-responsive CopG/Arc/MetJ family transcriptional regulator
MSQRPPATRRRPIGITWTDPLLRELDEYAQQRGLSRSAAVMLAVSEHLMRVKRDTPVHQST